MKIGDASARPDDNRANRLTERLTKGSCIAGILAMAGLMVGTTVVDVVLRRFGSGVPGALELVTLGLRILVGLGLPYTFWIGGHIAADLLTERLPPRPRRLLEIMAATASAAMLGILAWAAGGRAATAWRYGDVSVDLAIPVVWFWVPLIIGTILSIPVVLVRAAYPARL